MANITAAEHPKLVLEMTAMERTTRAYCDEWNVRHQQLPDNDKYLNEQFINVFLTVQQLIIPSTEGRTPGQMCIRWMKYVSVSVQEPLRTCMWVIILT